MSTSLRIGTNDLEKEFDTLCEPLTLFPMIHVMGAQEKTFPWNTKNNWTVVGENILIQLLFGLTCIIKNSEHYNLSFLNNFKDVYNRDVGR